MLLYRILIIVLSPVILGHITWLAARNKQSRYFWQRLGLGYSHLPVGSLWFHCASVGEINTLLPLLENIHKNSRQKKILITSNTITGARIIEKQNLDYIYHSYLPFDWHFSVNQFLSTIKPTSLNVMETEIWPNLFTACSNKNITISIINARLSKKTTSANSWIRSLIRNSLSKVSHIYARSDENALAFRQLGAAENIIETTGNLKLTTAIRPEEVSPETVIDREYVLVASTHNDEELQIYKVWKKLGRNELLIIVPRHPERSASITKQLKCNHLSLRSKQEKITAQTEVFILDTVGELKNYFNKAKIVIMGGSFIPIGGHNILEPASFNKAIITGPYMENFKEELDLMLSNDAIIQVGSITELQQQLEKLLDDEDCRLSLQNNTAELSHDAEKVLNEYTNLILDQ